jgi:hypothetical protein
MVEKISTFQQAIEAVEALELEEQALLVDIISKRLKQQHRDELLKEIAQAETDYAQGNVQQGSVADLMAELDDSMTVITLSQADADKIYNRIEDPPEPNSTLKAAVVKNKTFFCENGF